MAENTLPRSPCLPMDGGGELGTDFYACQRIRCTGRTRHNPGWRRTPTRTAPRFARPVLPHASAIGVSHPRREVQTCEAARCPRRPGRRRAGAGPEVEGRPDGSGDREAIGSGGANSGDRAPAPSGRGPRTGSGHPTARAGGHRPAVDTPRSTRGRRRPREPTPSSPRHRQASPSTEARVVGSRRGSVRSSNNLGAANKDLALASHSRGSRRCPRTSKPLGR